MEYVLLAMIILVVIVALMASRLTDNSYPFPFNRKEALFTSAEHNFQGLLDKALGDKYFIGNRVKLADMLTIRNGVSKKARQAAINNAQTRYLDYVICDKESKRILGALDLVDTQGKGYKVKKDWFVAGALESSGIPHIRIKVKANYTVDEIRACINSRLLGNSSPLTTTPEAPRKRLIKPRPTRPIRPLSGAIAPSLAAPQEPELARLPH
jgi:hypothetical protein